MRTRCSRCIFPSLRVVHGRRYPLDVADRRDCAVWTNLLLDLFACDVEPYEFALFLVFRIRGGAVTSPITAWLLLVGVPPAVPAPLDCRCQAFTGQNIPPLFRVCAVPFAAVRFAGLPLTHHPVGAAAKHAFAWTATMFTAETLGVRVGGAACHGARLLPSTAVFAAM